MFLLEFYRSTIGKKVIMAITGLLLVGFVIGHMLGHLQVFQSADKYNAYAHFLQSLGGVLWLARLGLLVAAVLHITMGIQLSARSRGARPTAYQRRTPQVSTWASRTMLLGGVLLAVFIVFHILHFTTLTIFPEYERFTVYNRMIVAFRTPWLVIFYVLATLALGFHLYHGAWSSMRTLGLTRASANPLQRKIPAAIAAIVTLGFLVVPLAIAAGMIREQPVGPAPVHSTATTTTATAPAAAAPATER
jgi:succinate dehydrogenase / fumarate reductase, cytochrome b subunit